MSADDDTTDVDVLGEKTRPANRIRVFYEGDPLSARVELLVMGDDGIQAVHDIPVESVSVYLSSVGASCILGIGGQYVTVHAEGAVDHPREERMWRLAKEGTPRKVEEKPEAPKKGGRR
jgi:hypothetical protein